MWKYELLMNLLIVLAFRSSTWKVSLFDNSASNDFKVVAFILLVRATGLAKNPAYSVGAFLLIVLAFRSSPDIGCLLMMRTTCEISK